MERGDELLVPRVDHIRDHGRPRFCPIAAYMHILDEVKAAWLQYRPEDPQRDIDHLIWVAAVINDDVKACTDIDSAAATFQERFLDILDYYAPIKIFQTRKHYVPYLSDDTKELMDERDALKNIATENKDETLFSEFRSKRNEVKKRLALDETKYHQSRLNDPSLDAKKAWKKQCIWK